MKCPYCGAQHTKFPRECASHIAEFHVIVCSEKHHLRCKRDIFRSYVKTMAQSWGMQLGRSLGIEEPPVTTFTLTSKKEAKNKQRRPI